MLMYQKKFELRIGEDSIRQSSDLSIGIPSCFFHQFEPRKQSTTTTTSPLLPTHHHHHRHSPTQPQPRTLPRLHIEIPPFSSNCCSSPRDQNEPIFRNQSTSKTLISTPHKRSMMSQSPSLSRSPTLSSLRQNHHPVNPEAPAGAAVAVGSGRSQVQAALSLQQPRHYHEKASVFNPNVSYHSFLCSPSSPVFLATKRITLRFIHHSCHASWLKVHLKFFMLISLPSVYLLTLTRHWSFLIRFLYVLAFSILLVFALHLALPRLPSIRFFLARILCIKQSSLAPRPKNHPPPPPPVVWSIGAKPKPKKGPISGSWVQVYSNGDVYEGEFHKGKCSGSGVYYYHLSGRYEGDWIDEKYDGYGVETWAKGSRYRGQYRQGLRHGVGFYRSYTGDSYSGEWCNGQCHGFGLHSCEDGSSYVGEFKLGAKHGLGHYHFRNGDTYAGEYFADKMHGFGVYRFGNGHRYEGAWHEGRRQGFGSYTFRNGDTHSGHWQNGILSASSIQGTITGSSLALDHAKVLHAVQEARRAAEKAGDLVNVDERVKRAVAAANKAATAARVAAVKAVQNQMHENEDSEDVPQCPDV